MARLSSEEVRRENAGDPSSVTSLNLSLRALSDVSCLGDFRNLGRLDVSCNSLTSLEGISICINLKWLSVAQNKLKSLRGIESLSKLTVLNASKNMLGSMDEIESLIELRALILNDNEISSICKLDQLKYLNTLVLSRNPIHEIGLSLKNSNSVTKLSLSKCKIQVVASSLISVLNLKELRLADNEITSLPCELARNIKLQNLDLGKNLIMRLSDLKVLSELHNLKNLNLQGNPVAENPKFVKKIRKMVPGLRIFNAKPIEKWNQSEAISEREIPLAIKNYRQDVIGLESKQKPKRKKSDTDATTSGNRRSDASNVNPDHLVDANAKNETKIKKHKVVENLLDRVISSTKVDKKSPFSFHDAKEKKNKKEKKASKVDSKSNDFDDGETSFMDFVLSGDTEKPASESSGLHSAWDEKLLGGVVVDHTKKTKGKKSRRDPPAVQMYSLVPDFGMGGPSTWDD